MTKSTRLRRRGLRNAFRHGEASQVEVEIRYDSDRFRLRVRDNWQRNRSRGFWPPVILRAIYGLRGMRERAAVIGGTLAVWSEVGAGTELELRLPAQRGLHGARAALLVIAVVQGTAEGEGRRRRVMDRQRAAPHRSATGCGASAAVRRPPCATP